MRRISFSAAALGFLLLISSCAGSIPAPTATQAEKAAHKWPGTSIASLARGRELYVSKCSGCHSLRPPAEYSEKRWEEILEEMKIRSSLSDEESRLIMKYLVAVGDERGG